MLWESCGQGGQAFLLKPRRDSLSAGDPALDIVLRFPSEERYHLQSAPQSSPVRLDGPETEAWQLAQEAREESQSAGVSVNMFTPQRVTRHRDKRVSFSADSSSSLHCIRGNQTPETRAYRDRCAFSTRLQHRLSALRFCIFPQYYGFFDGTGKPCSVGNMGLRQLPFEFEFEFECSAIADEAVLGSPESAGADEAVLGGPESAGADEVVLGSPESAGADEAVLGSPESAGADEAVLGSPESAERKVCFNMGDGAKRISGQAFEIMEDCGEPIFRPSVVREPAAAGPLQPVQESLHPGLIESGQKRNYIAWLLMAVFIMHAEGYAHLDIKPDNVMIKGGRPKLIDYGNAKKLQDCKNYQGSEGFGLPGVDEGTGDFNGRQADIYCLGLIVASILLGLRVVSDDRQVVSEIPGKILGTISIIEALKRFVGLRVVSNDRQVVSEIPGKILGTISISEALKRLDRNSAEYALLLWMTESDVKRRCGNIRHLFSLSYFKDGFELKSCITEVKAASGAVPPRTVGSAVFTVPAEVSLEGSFRVAFQAMLLDRKQSESRVSAEPLSAVCSAGQNEGRVRGRLSTVSEKNAAGGRASRVLDFGDSGADSRDPAPRRMGRS